jgi:hypothetical protein
LKGKNIVYVKDEGSNLNAMSGALKFVVNCESFGIEESFQGTCFRHVFSKACQYGTTKEKVYRNLKYVSVKFAQANLQKCITWPNKSGKGNMNGIRFVLKLEFNPKN